MPKRNPNSFDFYGDGDDIDVLRLTEEVFGIRIADEEAERIMTFGDFLDCVESKLPRSERSVCLLRKAFLELRNRMVGRGVRRLRPSLLVGSLGADERELLRWIDPDGARWRDAPIRAAVVTLVPLGVVAAMIGVPIVATLWTAAGPSAVVLPALIAAGAFLGRVVAKPRPQKPQSIADLLRLNFHQHYAYLASRFGPGLPSDRWYALESICRVINGHDGPVNRDTTFFSHHFPEGAR